MQLDTYIQTIQALGAALAAVSKSRPATCLVLPWHDGSRNRYGRLRAGGDGRLRVDRDFAAHAKGLADLLRSDTGDDHARYAALVAEVNSWLDGAQRKGRPLAEQVKEYVDRSVLELGSIDETQLEALDPTAMSAETEKGWSVASEIKEHDTGQAEGSTESGENAHAGALDLGGRDDAVDSLIAAALEKVKEDSIVEKGSSEGGGADEQPQGSTDEIMIRVGGTQYPLSELDLTGLTDEQLRAVHDRIHLASVTNDDDVLEEAQRRSGEGAEALDGEENAAESVASVSESLAPGAEELVIFDLSGEAAGDEATDDSVVEESVDEGGSDHPGEEAAVSDETEDRSSVSDDPAETFRTEGDDASDSGDEPVEASVPPIDLSDPAAFESFLRGVVRDELQALLASEAEAVAKANPYHGSDGRFTFGPGGGGGSVSSGGSSGGGVAGSTLTDVNSFRWPQDVLSRRGDVGDPARNGGTNPYNEQDVLPRNWRQLATADPEWDAYVEANAPAGETPNSARLDELWQEYSGGAVDRQEYERTRVEEFLKRRAGE